MRHPSQWLGDGIGIDFFGCNGGQMTIKLIFLDDVDRCRWHVMPLLITGGDESCLWVDPDKWLTQSVADDLERFPVGCDFDDRAAVLAIGCALLSAFGNVERAIRTQFHGVRELPCLCCLGKEIAEHLIAVTGAIFVGIDELPDAASVKDEQLILPRDDAHGFMQTTGKATPRYILEVAFQPRDEPYIAIKSHACRITLIIQESNVCQSHIPLPGIRNGQWDFVDDIGVGFGGESAVGGNGFRQIRIIS